LLPRQCGGWPNSFQLDVRLEKAQGGVNAIQVDDELPQRRLCVLDL
jgi:hypothetical protein